MNKLFLIFTSIIIINIFIFCYNHPSKKYKKPLYIKQYEESNRKEKQNKRKQIQILKPKEKVINYDFKDD